MDPINQQPSQPVTPTAMPSATPKKVGPIVTVLVIVLVLIAAAIYIFASGVNKSSSVPAGDTAAQVQPVSNTSDDVRSIEADLDASIDGLDNQNF